MDNFTKQLLKRDLARVKKSLTSYKRMMEISVKELTRISNILLTEVPTDEALEKKNGRVRDLDLRDDTEFTEVCEHLLVFWKKLNNGSKKDFHKLRAFLNDLSNTKPYKIKIKTLNDININESKQLSVRLNLVYDRIGIGEKTFDLIINTLSMIGIDLEIL